MERIFRVEVKMKENVAIVVTYGLNEGEKTSERDNFWEKLNAILKKS